MSYSVYMHTCKNDKKYIGITCQNPPEKRWLNGNGYKQNIYFYNAIQKYGWDNFKHEILFKGLTKEEAEQKEIELIAYYKSNKREYGYNISNGGSSNGKHSEETRKRMSKSQKGHKLSNETIEKIREANRNRVYKPHSEEAKKKMSEAMRGDKHPNYGKHLKKETRMKISESNKGHIVSKDTRNKLSKHFKEKQRSEETKKKISESMKGMKRSEETNKKLSKLFSIFYVRCIETEIIYDNLRDASEQTGIQKSNIWKCCKGERKTAGGYHWEYIDKSTT